VGEDCLVAKIGIGVNTWNVNYICLLAKPIQLATISATTGNLFRCLSTARHDAVA
jgi:hypothetical protein